ncbi:MAG: hypothetical protein JXQ29_18015 [Planctomycetes bacterium]|nr:hypothetical protein [Planctomycetota bacterium]
MKRTYGVLVGLLAGLAVLVGGCDSGQGRRDEIDKLHRELAEMKKEMEALKQIQADFAMPLDNLEAILKEVRRELGRNGDAIAGLRDHVTLTVRSFAADTKNDAAVALGEVGSDREALVAKLKELGVALDAEAGTLTLEGVVAIPAGALEFVCVAEGGKAHESLFVLAAEPRALHAGLLALDLEPGLPGRFAGDQPIAPVGPRVFLYATWTEDGKEVTHRVEDLIIDLKTQAPLKRGGFVYHGSRHQVNAVTGKRFYAPDVTRDLVAVWNSPNVVLDLDTPEAAWDDAYVANSERMPPKGTPVKVVVRLKEL